MYLDSIQEYLRSYFNEAKSQLSKNSALNERWLENHETRLDRLFGIDYPRAEAQDEAVASTQELYYGLSSAALNSSYLDIFRILSRIPKSITIHDLGAGYGRIGLINCLLNLPHRYHGYEYLQHRLEAANVFFNRYSTKNNNSIEQRDLVKRPISFNENDWYFFYLPIGSVVQAFFKNLLIKKPSFPIYIAFIESHGDFKCFIEHLLPKTRIRKFPQDLWFPRHDNHLYFAKIENFKLSHKQQDNFWYYYLKSNKKTEVHSRSKTGKIRSDPLSQCDLSFYQNSPYLTLPDGAITSFNDYFGWKLVNVTSR